MTKRHLVTVIAVALTVAMPAPAVAAPSSSAVRGSAVSTAVQATPVTGTPVSTQPVRTQPVRTQPVRTQPVRTQPVRGGKPTRPVRAVKPVKVAFTLAGTVTTVDTRRGRLTFTVAGGWDTSRRGKPVTVVVPATARVSLDDVRAGLGAVEQGDRVSVRGTRSGTTYTAVQVSADAAKAPRRWSRAR